MQNVFVLKELFYLITTLERRNISYYSLPYYKKLKCINLGYQLTLKWSTQLLTSYSWREKNPKLQTLLHIMENKE
jgi:hypothetical protein